MDPPLLNHFHLSSSLSIYIFQTICPMCCQEPFGDTAYKESENKSQWCWALKLSFFCSFVELAYSWLPPSWKCSESCSVASASTPFHNHWGLGLKKKTSNIVSMFLLQILIPILLCDAGFLIFTHAHAKKITLWLMSGREKSKIPLIMEFYPDLELLKYEKQVHLRIDEDDNLNSESY